MKFEGCHHIKDKKKEWLCFKISDRKRKKWELVRYEVIPKSHKTVQSGTEGNWKLEEEEEAK